MRGYCTVHEEFLYPDQALGALPEEISLHMARNGREAVRLLLDAEGRERISISVQNGEGFELEGFQMIDVGVNYNEVETEEQNGMFVITEKEYEKPA